MSDVHHSNTTEEGFEPNTIRVVHTVQRSWNFPIDDLRKLTGLADATPDELAAAVSADLLSNDAKGYPNAASEDLFEGPSGDFEDVVVDRTAEAYYHVGGDAKA